MFVLAADPQPDVFNYVVGLHLLFVAIGIGKVLDGLGWIIERRKVIQLWLHALALLLIGLLLLQDALASFRNYSIHKWSMGAFLLVISTPLIYAIIADLLFPSDPTDDGDILKTYRSQIRRVAFLVILSQVASTATLHLLHPALDRSLLQQQDITRGVACVLSLGLFLPLPRFRKVHEIVMCLLLGALLFYMVRLTPPIEFKG
jgi:hypothetical protein